MTPARPRFGAMVAFVTGCRVRPGAPTLWNLLSISVGPVWHSLHAALPMNSPRPCLALSDSCEKSRSRTYFWNGDSGVISWRG